MMNFSMLADITALSPNALPITQQDIPLRPNQQIYSNSNTLAGLFLIFLFIGYICIGFGYKKHRKDRKAAQLQQVKNLEKT